MASDTYHEPYEKIPDKIRELHRAFVSLMEELEAVDWYYQRASVSRNEALKEVLLHNAHEEIEHAMMVLEWIRREDPVFDKNMREYLFKEGDILAQEEASKQSEDAAEPARVELASLVKVPRRTLGSLRKSRSEP